MLWQRRLLRMLVHSTPADGLRRCTARASSAAAISDGWEAGHINAKMYVARHGEDCTEGE